MLFSEFERTDSSPKTNQESDFAFLDRSARPEIGRVRDYLYQLCQEYPDEEVVEQVARIQSNDDTNFRSAVFELLLYSALSSLGCALQPHPELPGDTASRPDFLVKTPDGHEFYLEAVLASPNDEANPGAAARIGVAIDALGKCSHPNFMVGLEMNGYPTTQPSGKRLRSEILNWLDSLDADLLLQEQELEKGGIENPPTFFWSHEAWEVLARPIPIKLQRRGKTTSLIGLFDGYAGFIDKWTPIRDAIKFKGGKYGTPDKPLLIAVNFASFNLDRIDEMQALYGQEQLVSSAGKLRMQRALNGVWRGKNGPQSTRVSGAWLFNDLTAYTAASRNQTVYFNPWAQHPLPEFVKAMPHAVLEGNKVNWEDGLTFREMLGLAEDWLG